MIRQRRIAAIWYWMRTWRCRLFGHTWGAGWINTETLEVRECQRNGCRGRKMTQHVLGGGRVERVYR